jgi:hypothetical protein
MNVRHLKKKTLECLSESTGLFPTGTKSKTSNCLNTSLETLVFSFHSIANRCYRITNSKSPANLRAAGKIPTRGYDGKKQWVRSPSLKSVKVTETGLGLESQ